MAARGGRGAARPDPVHLHVAGAVESSRSEFKPGVFGRHVLGQLSYDKALLVLVDSQTDEFVVCLAGLKYGGRPTRCWRD